MKWYQHLYWKIFLATWLVSALLMGGLVYGLLRMSETRHWQDLNEARAAGYAQLVIERHEMGPRGVQRSDMDRVRGRVLMRITRQDTGEIIYDFRRPPPPDNMAHFTLETESGRQYRVDMPLPEQPVHLERMLKFLLSVQMVSILVMSALVALLVSFWVVRPINRLRVFARSLYDEQNLTHRTEGYLSQRGDEIGELAREFDSMASYVEKTLAARQNLLRDVSHELRAPLARLQMAAGILEQQAEGNQNPLLDQINRECEQLAHLIDQLLSLSRLDDMALQPDELLLLKPFLTRIIEDAQLLYPEHSIELTLKPETLAVIQSEVLLERILGNALQNALKYSPAGSCVSLVVHQKGAHWIIEVRDQGPGVDTELLDQLFEPFVRGQQGGQGYGLGLSILRGAVRRLDGEVQAMNLPEGGFQLRITLPYAQA